jgi:hypothetical protein
MDANMQKFLGVMGFYILLSYVIFPVGFYYLLEKTLASAGNGFVLGSIVSIVLWFMFGRKMVNF